MKVRLAAIAAALLSLLGCAKRVTTAEHIEWAQAACSGHGGLHYIDDASVDDERESCGTRCSRKTGRVVFDATVMCSDWKSFHMRETR